MSFAMRVNFVDVLVSDTLHNTYPNNRPETMPDGYTFDIRLSYYRGHFLSVIDHLGLTVDGEEVPALDITFCLHGKEFYLAQFASASTEFWDLLTPAQIKVRKPGGLAEGNHDIKLDLMCRVPYLPKPGGPEGTYMPLNAGGEKVMRLMPADGRK